MNAMALNETVTGRVARILFPRRRSEDADTDYRIFVVESDGEEHSVKGTYRDLRVGTTVACDGRWERSERHGETLRAALIAERLPTDAETIRDYLGHAKIPGIGPVTAKRMVEAFGERIFDVLDREPHRLQEVKSIRGKTAAKIIEGWKARRGSHTVMLFLQEHGVPPAMSGRVYRHLGGDGMSAESVIERVKADPYLISAVRGIGFKTADRMGRELGIPADSDKRIGAAAAHVLQERSGQGNTMVPWDEAIRETASLTDLDESVIERALPRTLGGNKGLEQVVEDGKAFLALIWLRRSEERIAAELLRIATFGNPIAARGSTLLKNGFSIRNGSVVLDDSQSRAVISACTSGVSIITGRPGTGKTSSMRAIIDIADQVGRRIACCAPTGLAAMKLSEATGMPATTIHRLLGAGKRGKEEGPIDADLIVLDETSMVGTHLMANLLERVPNGCAMVFVGDVDQLRSVEAGNVLGDMIESRKFPVVRLTKIHRQSEVGGRGGGIVEAAHAVIEGVRPTFNMDDFRFVEQDDATIAADWIPRIVQKMNAQGTPYEEIQVISPMRKGPLGVEALNAAMQALLNPSALEKREMPFRSIVLREGDRVMQTQNDYDLGVFNGDIGYARAVDPSAGEVVVAFRGGRVVAIERGRLENLTHAFCVTIHKFQGSETDRIILPVHNTHYVMLNRNLLYTAITRARRQCVLVGMRAALATAVRTKSNEVRCTGLRSLIEAASAENVLDRGEVCYR